MSYLRVLLISFNLDASLPLSTAVLRAYCDSREHLRDLVELSISNHICYELDPENRCELDNVDEFIRSIINKSTDVIGFSTYLWNRKMVLKTAAKLKQEKPRLRVVIGGPEVTFVAEEVLRDNPAIDFVVRGEGEETFADLLENLSTCHHQPRLDEIRGLSYRTAKGTIISNPARPALLSPLDHVSPYTYLDAIPHLDHRYVGLETARGCVNQCNYCGYALSRGSSKEDFADSSGRSEENSAYASAQNRGLRFVKEERVFENIDTALRAGVSMFVVHDPSLFAQEQRALKILQYIIDRGGMFRGEFNLEPISERVIDFLAEHRDSFTRLGVGLQTTNPRAAAHMNRRSYDLKRFHRNAVRLIQCGVPLIIELISGLPGDDYAGLKKSIDFAYNLHPSLVRINPLQVLPGTCFSDKANEHGLVFDRVPPYRVEQTWSSSAADLAKGLALTYLVNNISIIFARRPHWELVNLILRMATVAPSLLMEELACLDHRALFTSCEYFDWVEADLSRKFAYLCQLLYAHNPVVFKNRTLEYLTELYYFLHTYGAYQEFTVLDPTSNDDRETILFQYPVHEHVKALLQNRVPAKLVQELLVAKRQRTRIQFSHRRIGRFRRDILE